MIPRENIKAGDRAKCCLDVGREPRGQQIFIKTHLNLWKNIYSRFLYDGLIEIKSSAEILEGANM